jgi:hypothetical protein
MSKRDYVRAAGIIGRIDDNETKRQVAEEFATWFAEENYRFNRAVFMLACGVTG